MPLSAKIMETVKIGLQRAAEKGQYRPGDWVISHDDDGGCDGCGFGQIGTIIANAIGGARFAREALPIGCTQSEVNEVLKLAGVTRAEIKAMNPKATWEEFDERLDGPYNESGADPAGFIAASLDLAEFLNGVLDNIAVIEEEPAVDLGDSVIQFKPPTGDAQGVLDLGDYISGDEQFAFAA